MRLSASQLEAYGRDGYVLLERQLPAAAIDRLAGELGALVAQESPRRVLEADGVTVRSLYGCHLDNELYRSLTRHPTLLEPARQIAGQDLYVYQLKINFKSARSGDLWAWHQDLIYWHKEDGLRGDQIVNLVVFLDDVTAENGPIWVVPGSHVLGMIEVPPRSCERPAAYRASPSWIDDVIAAIKYTIDAPTLNALLERFGRTRLDAPRGSVLIFHPNLVHASPPNPSSFDRRLLFLTYNNTHNLPTSATRPDFLVNPDHRALQPAADRRFDP